MGMMIMADRRKDRMTFEESRGAAGIFKDATEQRTETGGPTIGLKHSYQEPAMDKDSTLPDDFDHYDYYRYISGGDEPDVGIRFLIDGNGLEIREETINLETGELRNSGGWVSGIRNGPFFEVSTEEEFNHLNAERMAWAKRRKQQAQGVSNKPAVGGLWQVSEVQRDDTRYIREEFSPEEFTYRYYTIGTSHPVRMLVDRLGRPVAIEGPDRMAQRLVFKDLLSTVQSSPDADEIDRETFERMCMELDSLDVSGTYGKPLPPRP